MESGGNDFNDFLRIDLTNFVQFKQYYGKSPPTPLTPGNNAYADKSPADQPAGCSQCSARVSQQKYNCNSSSGVYPGGLHTNPPQFKKWGGERGRPP